MARRKLKAVPELPPPPPPPGPQSERKRYFSVGSLSMFKTRWGETSGWLTIAQLEKAYVNIKRCKVYGLEVTPTDLDLLRFIFTFGAPEGGRHRWRAYGTPMPLVRALRGWTHLAEPHIRASLRRLQKLELIDVHDQEVWTTEQLHRVGAEILWCDLLNNACPTDFDRRKLDWYTVTRDADRIFRSSKLEYTSVGDRRTVMLEVAREVQRRCT